MANLSTIEEKKKKTKKGGQGNKGRTSKKKTKKEDSTTSMKIDKKQIASNKLKNLGNRVLVKEGYKFPKDVDKDPFALTLRNILLDKI